MKKSKGLILAVVSLVMALAFGGCSTVHTGKDKTAESADTSSGYVSLETEESENMVPDTTVGADEASVSDNTIAGAETSVSDTTISREENEVTGNETSEADTANSDTLNSDTSNSETVAPTPENTEIESLQYIDADDTVYALVRLNVRAAESVAADILGVLESGEAVNRTGIHEEWTRIIYKGQTAFVASDYVSEVQPTEAPTLAATSEGTGIYYENGGYLVAIDAGHQAKGNSEQEPVGPGAAETKPKVSSGTQGVTTGIPEHEMNLVVSLYLRDELLARGYSVLMIRETAEVDISNAERAELANSYNADIFVRVHGNSVSNQEVKGALTMCMTKDNPYNGNLHNPSRVLSEKVLEGLCSATGAVNKGILETDTMSGINWCDIPVTIVEMGFMSNPDEDRAMAEDSYRRALAKGIADGIDAYFGR